MARIVLRFAESAMHDLEAIRQWHVEQGAPEAGQRILQELLESVESLRSHPELGRIVPEFGQPFLRELIRPPYRIVHRRDPGRVRVVRVWRSERALVLPEE